MYSIIILLLFTTDIDWDSSKSDVERYPAKPGWSENVSAISDGIVGREDDHLESVCWDYKKSFFRLG